MVDKLIMSEPDMQGWLCKWTNYLKGYQRRWFVLSDGLLSYYRNQAEMVHTCRGTISLHGAFIHTEDSCTFVITNNGAQTFHIRATNEVQRQLWVTALELAKAKSMQQIDSGEDSDDNIVENAKVEVTKTIHILSKKMEDLQMCYDLIHKHGNTLQKSLSELETLDSVSDMIAQKRAINERATLFRIASNKMINTCSEYLDEAQTQGRKWQKMLHQEREQRIQLEEMVGQLAREQTALEQVPSEMENKNHHVHAYNNYDTSSDDENAEFYDAQGGEASESSSVSTVFQINNYLWRVYSGGNEWTFLMEKRKVCEVFDKIVKEELAAGADDGSSSDVDETIESAAILTAAIRSSATMKNKTSLRADSEGINQSIMTMVLSERAKNALKQVMNNPWTSSQSRRKRVPDKPQHPLQLWNILKNCIGKDLSKIPMPVNFSEPLSMLQRLTEDFEYAHILDAAANCSDPLERLAYIAAFTISSYSTTSNRTSKPFNPLLGETYECDRISDLGWRCISEQVSHHPPISAQYCEGKKWVAWQEFTMSSKFRGKYLQVTPSGISNLQFKDSDDHYSWTKVTTTVNNIIVGKLWVEQSGDMEIINNTNGSKCKLTYVPYRYFSREKPRKVQGVVVDSEGKERWHINGTWDSKVEISSVANNCKEFENSDSKNILVWQRVLPPDDCDKYYFFTELACQLNEMEHGIAPTDSRLRPDQRLMELGMWDEANIEKLRLEEKQRQKRKGRSIAVEDHFENGDCQSTYDPIWFTRETDPNSADVKFTYNNRYWQCKEKSDWNQCPDIF